MGFRGAGICECERVGIKGGLKIMSEFLPFLER